MEVDFPSSSSHYGSSSSSFRTEDDDGGFMGWDGSGDDERKSSKLDKNSKSGRRRRRKKKEEASNSSPAGDGKNIIGQHEVVNTKTNDGNSRHQNHHQQPPTITQQRRRRRHRKRSTIDDAMEYQQDLKRRDSYNSTFTSGTELSVDFPIAPRRLSSNCSSVTFELATAAAAAAANVATPNVETANDYNRNFNTTSQSEIITHRQLIQQEKQRWDTTLHNNSQQNQQLQYQKQQSQTTSKHHSSPATSISRQSTPTHSINLHINPPFQIQSLNDTTVTALPIIGWDMDSSLASSSSATASWCTQEAGTSRRSSFLPTYIENEKKGEAASSSGMIMSYDPRASFKAESVVVPPYTKKCIAAAAAADKNTHDSGGGKSLDKSIINKNDKRSTNSAASTTPTSQTTPPPTQQQQQLVTVPPQRLISSWSSLRRSGHSSSSMSTSIPPDMAYNDSMTDMYYQQPTKKGDGGGDLCEEFVERQRRISYDSSKISKQQQRQIGMRSSLQPQDEINPNKPWLTIPPTTTTTTTTTRNANGEEFTLGLGGGNTTNNQANKRGSGMTTRSSIESSLTESFLLATILLQSKYDATTTDDDNNGTMIETCLIDNDDITTENEEAAVTTTNTTPTRDNDVAHFATDRGGEEMSVLSVDDDGSELTELRHAQEALFNDRRDSVVSNSSKEHQMQNISELDVIVQDEEEEIEVRQHSLSDQLDETEPFLEVDDLDYPRRRCRNIPQLYTNNPFSSSSSSSSSNNPFSGDSDEESNSERRNNVDYRLESVKTTLDDSSRNLPSYARNDISRRASDDSVLYSDIDPAPSIKMCMTVRDTMIEREFDTIQLADIEYGEKKTKKKSTLEDLFEGNDDIDASYASSQYERSHPSKNRSKTGKFATNLSDKKKVLMDGMVKTAAITTKIGHTRSAKNIRRKNKRRWKYCVWNCRKITLVIVLSLTLIIGVGILSRWGYSKQLASSNAVEAESENDSSVAIMEGTPPTMFPSLSEGGGLESIGTDSQSPLNGTSNSSYPTPSLISSITLSSFPTFSGINNNHTYNASQSLHPNATVLPNSTSIVNISDIYMSIQIIKGSNAFEHAGSSVSMAPNGEFIAVGYKEADGLAAKKTGLVRVYQRNSMNTSYISLGRDSMYGKATDDEFGASVSISNDGQRVAVGARSSSSMDKMKNGEVIVFEYNKVSQSWLQLGNSIQGMQDAVRLGFSVSLSGDGFRLAVGAPKDGTGSVGVYDYNYEGKEWVILDDFILGELEGDRTGFSVSLSNDGSTVAVGSAFTSSSNGDLSSIGSSAVYKIEGRYASNSSFSLIKQGQTLVGANDDAHFGYSISLSSSGTRLAVGSNGFKSENLTKAGRCAVYELREENWIEIGHLIGTEENEETGLHVAIALNGSVFSCSKKISVGGASIGSVAILEEVKAGWNVLDIIGASLGKSSSFGESVSLSQDGKWIVAGDPSYYSSRGFVEILTALD